MRDIDKLIDAVVSGEDLSKVIQNSLKESVLNSSFTAKRKNQNGSFDSILAIYYPKQKLYSVTIELRSKDDKGIIKIKKLNFKPIPEDKIDEFKAKIIKDNYIID